MRTRGVVTSAWDRFAGALGCGVMGAVLMLAGCLRVSSEADGALGGDGAPGGSGMFGAAGRGSQPACRPNDPVLARDLDLAAALRVAGRSLPGPDDDARARMRAHLMSEIGGPVRLEGRQDRGAPHASSTGLPSATNHEGEVNS